MKALSSLVKTCFNLLAILVVIQLPLAANAQKHKQHPIEEKPEKPGSLEFLQHCRGFNDIVLGQDVTRLPEDKLAYLDGDPAPDIDSCFKFEYKDASALELGGGLFLDLVGIRTFKNKIVNIYLFFKKDEGHRILENFIANYGPSTSRIKDFMYDWKSSAVNLYLRYAPDYELGVAIFTLNEAENKLTARRLANSSTIAQAGR